MHVLLKLAEKYPQLLLPIQEGMKTTEEYRNVVLRGQTTDRVPDFTYSDNDVLETIDTEAGPAEVLTLIDRTDFEKVIQKLAHRCEPTEIPASMGASTIIGLNNWEKVRAGEENYKDMIIVLSSGIYSNVTAEDVCRITEGKVNLNNRKWIEKSVIIRKYHELRHFVDRRLRPDDIDALRDEINADYDGIVAAFGYYDKKLASLFLGIEGETYRKGGRLENYLKDGEDFEQFIKRAEKLIEQS